MQKHKLRQPYIPDAYGKSVRFSYVTILTKIITLDNVQSVIFVNRYQLCSANFITKRSDGIVQHRKKNLVIIYNDLLYSTAIHFELDRRIIFNKGNGLAWPSQNKSLAYSNSLPAIHQIWLRSHINWLTWSVREVISTTVTPSSRKYFFNNLISLINTSSEKPKSLWMLSLITLLSPYFEKVSFWPASPGKWKTIRWGSPIPTCTWSNNFRK